MGTGRVQQDEIETAVDNRADRSSLPPHFVAIQMLEIILEAVRPQKHARRQRSRSEVDRAAANPEQAFDHRSDLGRGHVGPELGDLPVLATALPDDGLPVFHSCHKADRVEIRTVLGPVLDG